MFNFHFVADLGGQQIGGKMRYVVMTSKQDVKIPVEIKRARIIIHDDSIEWVFKTEKEAERAVNAFSNTRLESVRRTK